MAKPPTKPAKRSGLVKRTVDLGREEELVTWNEWFARSMAAMKHAVPKEHHERLSFRVALADGRVYSVRQVLAHVARGKCTIQPSRWNEREAICDIITGYLFLGVGDDEVPTALCVSPLMITSVECALVSEDDASPEHRTPFGFYKREGMHVPTGRKEVEETLIQAI